jgi:large subunit ribosomal protein L25
VDVPIRLLGSSPGVKAAGILMHTVTDLTVRCLPDQIPDHLEIDISSLQIGDAMHVRDLLLPDGVVPELDGDRVICSVAPPIVAAPTEAEEAAAAAEAAAAIEPEVIRRGKEEDEG